MKLINTVDSGTGLKSKKPKKILKISKEPHSRLYKGIIIMFENQESKKKDIITNIKFLKSTMSSVSTNGIKITDLETEYELKYRMLDANLKYFNIVNPNPYATLREWQKRWNDGSLTTYDARKRHVANLYLDVEKLVDGDQEKIICTQRTQTNWKKIDESISEMQMLVETASTVKQIQQVGFRGRKIMDEIIQQVFDVKNYTLEENNEDCKSIVKIKSKAYLKNKLPKDLADKVEKYMYSALDLANYSTQNITPPQMYAKLCLTSVITFATLIKTIEDNM